MELILAVSIMTLVAMYMLILGWQHPLFFFGLHIFSRAVLDSMPETTYSPLVAGISAMQIYSMLVIFYMSMFIFRHRQDNIRAVPAVLPVILVMTSHIVSGIISNDWVPVLENTTKWLYMILLAGFVFHVLRTSTLDTLMSVLWIAVLPAVIIQLTSIISNDYVITSAGHVGYFGGYQHQNMISYYLLGFTSASLFLALQNRSLLRQVFFGLAALYGIFAVYACGYRTTLIALMLFILATFIHSLTRIRFERKLLALSLTPLVLILGLYFAGDAVAHRLMDIWIFIKDPLEHIDFSGNARITPLFSGRLYIINTLMHAYLSAPWESMWAGLGLDSARLIIGTYPHNEYLAALVECGLFGLAAFVLFTFRYFWTINFSFPRDNPAQTVIAGTGTGLLIMTLATMPFRDMRAMILFGVILGTAHFFICKRREASGET